MIKEWFHNTFGCHPEYPLPSDNKQLEQKRKEAEKASHQADEQLMESRRIREEGKVVGSHARQIRYENNFTARIRQALEGR